VCSVKEREDGMTKQNSQIRRKIKKYLQDQRSMSLSDLARTWQISKGTLSDFLKGKDFKIDHELAKRMSGTVAPWEVDLMVKAGEIKKRLLRERRTHEEIRIIGMEIAKEYQTTP
jgi:predicted transcriptional regulator